MKSLKAAAVVAGTVALAGITAPAFANDTSDWTPTSLNGAVNKLTEEPITLKDAMPIRHQPDVVDTKSKGSPRHEGKGKSKGKGKGKSTGKAVGTTSKQHKPLLGGLPLHG
ncbi:hypothetical protein JK361_11045 [Streptomyces sp. 5-8]|uniref:Uncharacterized protein n=1 Tax=Streptomyces musisoli TaxID=2802280 RepID=A0ABS1NYW5_9ACTN|nr:MULTISPECIES: hypothetical protein [Streptomyces]MBL1105120.1 hypothetical protein [Streptomyces musisoli]MBY8846626.1 hypothetical protein [Streptomyces sp. SP2-10]